MLIFFQSDPMGEGGCDSHTSNNLRRPLIVGQANRNLAARIQISFSFSPPAGVKAPAPKSDLYLPAYPAEMWKKGISGTVKCKFTVNKDGRVGDTILKEYVTEADGTAAAVDAVRREKGLV